jgi:hypothetical protein
MPLESGGVVNVEVADDAPASIVPVGRGSDAAAAAVRTFRQALSEVMPAVEEVLDQMRTTASQPDRVAVQFGVKITGETTAILAKAAGEANFTITAEWGRPQNELCRTSTRDSDAFRAQVRTIEAAIHGCSADETLNI